MVAPVTQRTIYKDRAKQIIAKLTNQVHMTLYEQHICFDIESQKNNFIKKLHTTPPQDIIDACQEFLEASVKPSYSWQPDHYSMPGSSQLAFRRLLKEAEGQNRFTADQLERCFAVFTENLHSRLSRLAPDIIKLNHIKPYGVDEDNKPVFLMCEPNTSPQTANRMIGNEPNLFSYATPYVGRLYIWQMMKNAIEAAGGEVRLVKTKENNRKERDVFVRDPLIRDTYGVIIRPEWHDDLIECEQPQILNSIAENSAIERRKQKEKTSTFIVKRVHASIENGNIATDHKRHILFIGHDEDHTVKLDALELQAKTKSRVIPLVIDNQQAVTFYHLDMALTELQSGQFIWCPKAFTAESRALIEKTIPAEDRIAVDMASAKKGACNCVTVGKTVITPFASEVLKERLQAHGYHVETSETVGLPHGELLKFGLGAIHCATFFIGNAANLRC